MSNVKYKALDADFKLSIIGRLEIIVVVAVLHISLKAADDALVIAPIGRKRLFTLVRVLIYDDKMPNNIAVVTVRLQTSSTTGKGISLSVPVSSDLEYELQTSEYSQAKIFTCESDHLEGNFREPKASANR